MPERDRGIAVNAVEDEVAVVLHHEHKLAVGRPHRVLVAEDGAHHHSGAIVLGE